MACYNTVKEDKRISKHIQEDLTNPYNWTPEMVTIKREFYDMAHPGEPLNIDRDIEAAQKLVEFERKQVEERHKDIYGGRKDRFFKDLIAKIRKLKNITYADRKDMSALICYKFSEALDNIVKNNSSITREEAAKKEDYIFDQIYDYVQSQIHKFNKALETTEDVQERVKLNNLLSDYNTILKNWSGLVAYSKKQLYLTEGVKLGVTKSFAKYLGALDTVEEELIDYAEETNRDPDTFIKSEELSSFNTASQVTRALLRKLYVYESTTDENGHTVYTKDADGNYIVKTNRFGIPVMMNALAAHKFLASALTKAKNSYDCITILKDLRDNGDCIFLDPLIHEIDVTQEYINPDTRSALTDLEITRNQSACFKLSNLYIDFNKVNQKYAILHPLFKKSVNKEMRILNRRVNPIESEYNLKLLNLEASSTGNTLWGKDGKMVPSRYYALMDTFEWFRRGGSLAKLADGEKEFTIKYRKGITKQIADRLFTLSQLMGIPLTNTMCFKIASDKRLLTSILNNIKGAWYQGASYSREVSAKIPIDYKLFYSTVVQTPEEKDSNEEKGTRSHMKRLAYNIINAGSAFDYKSSQVSSENRVRHKNSKGDMVTLFSTINPGYLSQFVKEIQIRSNNLPELRQWMDENLAINPAFCKLEIAQKEAEENNGKFVSTKKFRLSWLNDLYNGNNKEDIIGSAEDMWLFANNIEVIRCLSDDLGKPFEDFSEAEHLELILDSFYTLKRKMFGSQKRALAYYPVFISGDANQYKTLTAPVYKVNEIMDGLVEIYYMERKLQALEEAALQKMKDDGVIDDKEASLKVNPKEFGLVPEFNTIFKNENLTELDNNPDKVKKLIKEHFRLDITSDCDFLAFRDYCEANGVGYVDKNNHYVFPKSCKDIVKGQGDTALYEFWLNYKFATVQQMALMTTSVSYYKNVKDLQKRYKETHSSGTPLDLNAMYKGEYAMGLKKDGSINNIMRTLYIQDVEMNTEELDENFMKTIANIFGKNSSVYKSYKEVSTTDGQAYRTLESYRKVMICAGGNKWTKENEEFYQRLKTLREQYGHNIPENELVKLGKIGAQFQPIKPFMFTHEKYGLNDDNYLDIPVQIKDSEAVMIPEFLPQNSKLRRLIEYCEEKKIDVAVYTSAIKVGAWGQIDISSASSVEDMNKILDGLKPSQIHQLDYSNYLIQTNVPPHNYDARLFATQIRKLIMGGKYNQVVKYFGDKLPKLNSGESNYDEKTVKRFYNELICANFIESLNNYLVNVSDPSKVVEIIGQYLISNDRSAFDDVLGLEINEDGDLTMPLCEAIQEHDMVTTLLAAFKKMVNRQTILGGSGVQVSSYGIKDYVENNNLHFLTNEDNTNVLQAQVIVPLVETYVDSNGVPRTIDYDKYVNNDTTLKTNSNGEYLIDIDFPGIREFIAYRIPTERDYSMINCIAVGFTRPQMGGTIQVPSQCTKISGFDFDIDKLFFMFKAFHQDKEGKWIEYDYSKTADENPKFARDNMIIHIIQKRLTDDNTKKERLTPGGFEDAKKVAKWLEYLMNRPDAFKDTSHITMEDILKLDLGIDPTPNYNYTDPQTAIRFNQQNQLAAKLIGIFANQNVNHVYASGLNILKLNTPIAFGKYADRGLFDLLNPPEGVDTADTLAQFLAASVDAVKEPVLNYLNLNTLTAGAACMLARLGYDMFDIGLLLNQPIIKYICKYAYKRGCSLSSAINNFYTGNNFSDITASNPTREELMFNLANKDEDDYKTPEQIAILKLFEQIVKASSELNLFVSKTKFTAANSIKPNFGNFYALQEDLQRFADFEELVIDVDGSNNPIDTNLEVKDTKSYIKKVATNPLAFEQCMYDCMKKAMNALLKYFPYNNATYTRIREYLTLYNRYGSIDDKTINLAHRDFPVFSLSTMVGSIFNRDEYMEDSEYTRGEWYNRVFPRQLMDLLIKYPELKDNYLIQLINIEEDENNNLNIKMNYATSIDNSTDIDALKEAWEELMYYQSDDEEKEEAINKLAEDLFFYNFFKTGFGYGDSSFIRYAPEALKEYLEVKDGLSYADFWRRMLVDSKDKTDYNSEFSIRRFFKAFLINHPELNRYTKPIYDNLEIQLKPKFTEGDNFLTTVTLTKEGLDENVFNDISKKVVIKRNGNEYSGYVFYPILKFTDKSGKSIYYIQKEFSGDLSSTVIYERFEPMNENSSYITYGSTGIQNNEETHDSGEKSAFMEGSTKTQEEMINDEPIGDNKPTKDKDIEEIAEDLKEFAKEVINLSLDIAAQKNKADIDDNVRPAAIKAVMEKATKDDLVNHLMFAHEELRNSTNASRKALLDKLLKEAVEKDLIVLDENGNPMKSCK